MINLLNIKNHVGLVALLAILATGCSHKKQNVKSFAEILSAIQLPSSQSADLVLFKSWVFEKPRQIRASFLYITSGIDNIDKGSPDWGTTNTRNFRMIGDYAGELRVYYNNQITDTIPLVYGYTLWFKHGWTEGKEPFVSDMNARGLLDSTLYLNHVYDENNDYVLRVRLRNAAVNRIDYFDNRLKEGHVKFRKFQLSGVENENLLPDSLSLITDSDVIEGFYSTHTVDTINIYSIHIKHNLKRLMYLLYYFDFEHEKLMDIDIPGDYNGPSILFSGEPEANIISSVFHHNLADQVSRVDTNGIVHESAFNAPSWFYDGFGTWTNTIGIGGEKNGSYYECYYTRNKTILILPDLNYIEESNRALALLDKQLMYFPENYPSLQLAGKKIPGHWTVIANKPLIYSHVLTGVGWPTQYTFKKFGSHCLDFGNPETDGHGHSMMSHWKTWHNCGRDEQWVWDRWNYLKEAADYILWHLDNPDLSFSKYGLLYAESEAAMNDYSLYCNFPCYLGLLMYSEMADTVREKEYSLKWRTAAQELKDSMEAYFAADDTIYGKIWRKVGFYHENILMTLKEYAGFDLTDKLPDEWMQRSLNTYLKDRDRKSDYYGPVGLGYDHGVITQTAMLLDRMDEVTKWMRNLAHLCYAPRLPKPYIVPECASIDVKRGILRRQGDVGNGYQQAEIINTILLCAGIDDNVPGMLRIIPRLPENWSMKITDYPVIVYSQGSSHTSKIELSISYPEKKAQTVYFKVTSGGDLANVNFRLGPYNATTEKVRVSINNQKKSFFPCFKSGDKAWIWLKLDEIKSNTQIRIEVKE
jgi:hypothetical protein